MKVLKMDDRTLIIELQNSIIESVKRANGWSRGSESKLNKYIDAITEELFRRLEHAREGR